MEYQNWLAKNCSPIGRAIQDQDLDGAKSAVMELKRGLGKLDATPEYRELCTISAHWHEYITAKELAPSSELGNVHRRFFSQIDEPLKTPEGEASRIKALLCARCHADAEGFHPVSQDEIEDYLTRIPKVESNTLVWHHIASWAFIRRHEELACRAFEVLLTRPEGRRSEAKYRRISLMYALIKKDATPETVHQYVDRVVDMLQMKEFVEHIQPVCEEQGIIDQRVKLLIEMRKRSLRNQLRDKFEEVTTIVPGNITSVKPMTRYRTG